MIIPIITAQQQQLMKRKIRIEDVDDHQHQSANSKNKKREIISADPDDDGKDWTTRKFSNRRGIRLEVNGVDVESQRNAQKKANFPDFRFKIQSLKNKRELKAAKN